MKIYTVLNKNDGGLADIVATTNADYRKYLRVLGTTVFEKFNYKNFKLIKIITGGEEV